MLSGASYLSALDDEPADAPDFLDLFFPPFLVPPLLVILFAAFLVPLLVFFAADLRAPPFFADFLAALLDFFALPFLVPLPPPLRAPLDFLLPFLAAISFAPFVDLSLAHRNKII